MNWILQQRVATEYLNSIYFTDPNKGYSVGMTGQIIKTTNGGLSFINVSGNIVPGEYILYQNYPNPFNPKTLIKYFLKKSVHVKLKVYNLLGKEVKTIVNEKQNAGINEVEFNSEEIPSGIYFYSLIVNEINIDTKKCILVK